MGGCVDRRVCVCVRVCEDRRVLGWKRVRIYIPACTERGCVRVCVCSINYAAMYNLVCYLNSTSTVHWFLSLRWQLHTDC